MRIPLLVSGNPNVLVFYYTGNGSASFDPGITTSVGVNVSWKPDDAPETVTSGTTHNFSYTPSAGYHKCVVRVNGGLGLIDVLQCDSDSIVTIRNCLLANKTRHFYTWSNGNLIMSTGDIPRSSTNIDISGCSKFSGSLAQLPSVCYVQYLQNSSVTGSLSSLNSISTIVYLFGCTGVAPASIAHLTAIRDIRIYSMWAAYAAADSVDIVINSMWAARANYTYATPSLQIGGTNPAPTGNYIAPEEGTDWHLDGATWVPLTPNSKAYDLVNDVNDEGFNTWTISKN